MRAESTPQPDWTAMYCLPSTANDNRRRRLPPSRCGIATEPCRWWRRKRGNSGRWSRPRRRRRRRSPAPAPRAANWRTDGSILSCRYRCSRPAIRRYGRRPARCRGSSSLRYRAAPACRRSLLRSRCRTDFRSPECRAAASSGCTRPPASPCRPTVMGRNPPSCRCPAAIWIDIRPAGLGVEALEDVLLHERLAGDKVDRAGACARASTDSRRGRRRRGPCTVFPSCR